MQVAVELHILEVIGRRNFEEIFKSFFFKIMNNMILIFIFAWTSSISYGSKLERWTDPNVEGSIQPNALADASRQPKLFFEVRIISSIKESH